MHIGWPQGIFLALAFVELCVFLGMHGKPRPDFNAGAQLFDTALIVGLLYWGGFFS
jgi:hypothetical protein